MRAMLLIAALAAPAAWAQPAPPTPFAECDAAIAAAARPPVRLPPTLLPSIARVESGRLDPATGRVRPWPWTINVEGVGSFFDSKPQVIAAVQGLQARGVRSIDVGCMQVNLMHHPRAFTGLEDAFDPGSNARYAVTFLSTLYRQTHDWNLATAMYHSQTPERGEEYQRLVFGRVMVPMGALRTTGPYGVWPPKGLQFGSLPPANFAFGAFAAPKPFDAGYRTPDQTIGRFSLPSPSSGTPDWLTSTTSSRPGRR